MESITITDYYEYDDLTEKLDRLVEEAPRLVRKRSLGSSPEGRDVWMVTVANRDGPPVDRRPALLLTANLHAPEVAGSWVALHCIQSLVASYTSDATIQQMLDEHAFYVLPRIAPDGADVALTRRGKIVRSRYIEADPDSIYEPNEVVPKDLTGDGRILQMRWPAEDGGMVPIEEGSPAMVPWNPDAEREVSPQRYRVVTEGEVVNPDDGEIRDCHYGFRRSDFNRNFPTDGWKPLDLEGHGPYPLSEPETRAVANFLYAHPNVTAVLDLHTGTPAIFYPSKLAGSEPAHPSDASMLREIGEKGEESTGFSYVWGYGEFTGASPATELPGSLKDFAYERLGVPSLLIELGMLYNSLGMEAEDLSMDGTAHQRERTALLLEHQAAHPERPVFHEWVPYDHPDIGRVEIGGLDRTTHGNPPPSEMPEIAASVTEFALMFATYHPKLHLRNLTEESVGPGLHRVTVSVVNRGRLPTHLTEQGRATNTRIPDRPRVELSSDRSIDLITGRRREKLPHLSAHGGRHDLEWVVRAVEPATIEIEVTGARGVYAVTSLTLE